jgi:hypothetical protein
MNNPASPPVTDASADAPDFTAVPALKGGDAQRVAWLFRRATPDGCVHPLQAWVVQFRTQEARDE